MDAAGVSIQHDALVILLLGQRKAVAVRAQPRVSIEEISLWETQKLCNPSNLIFLDSHIPWPFAASGAALALIENRWL